MVNTSVLQLEAYEGAGNRTPVCDISGLSWITDRSPSEVRKHLESDLGFRQWLQEEGKNSQADSIMIFYPSADPDYDFVTFVGEPGADISSPFSDMCGNGIRALTLHILLSASEEDRKRYMHEGIRIHAGEVRTIRVDSLDLERQESTITVDMGPYQNGVQNLSSFIDISSFHNPDSVSGMKLNGQVPLLSGSVVSMGYNGRDIGEPHLVMFLEDIASSTELFPLNELFLIEKLRYLSCKIGNLLTFRRDLFPQGINVNIAAVCDGRIYMSTHERNLLPSQDACLHDQTVQDYCHCNTLACGTGGASVANEAYRRGLIDSGNILTIHPGGAIQYSISDETTLMIGPARKI